MSEAQVELDNGRAAEEEADKLADLIDALEDIYGVKLDPWQRILAGALFYDGVVTIARGG